MAVNQDLPVTDSAAALHELVGKDATAAFENDPKFVDSNPAVDGSSENLQTRTDRRDTQSQPDLNTRAAAEDDEDEDDEDEDLDDEDEEDEDEDEDELDDEDEDDDEYEDVDDDEDDEDDAEDEDEE